jgi:hypothetical protein
MRRGRRAFPRQIQGLLFRGGIGFYAVLSRRFPKRPLCGLGLLSAALRKPPLPRFHLHALQGAHAPMFLAGGPIRKAAGAQCRLSVFFPHPLFRGCAAGFIFSYAWRGAFSANPRFVGKRADCRPFRP